MQEDDLIEIVYLNGGTEKGLAKTWDLSWETSHESGYTIKQYRILKKSSVLTRFFSFISDNQNDTLVVAATSIKRFLRHLIERSRLRDF